MVTKIGLGTLLFGVLLGLGSCVLMGSAAKEAGRKRQVAVLSLEPGARESVVDARTEGGSEVELRFAVELVLRQAFVERERDRTESFSSDLPVNYQVLDRARGVVHLGAGKIRCSAFVPSPDSPRADRFDTRIDCSHRSESFVSPADGRLEIVTAVPAEDEYGNPLRSARVEVFDRLGHAPGQRAAASLLAMMGGFVLSGIGLLVLVVGRVATRRSAA